MESKITMYLAKRVLRVVEIIMQEPDVQGLLDHMRARFGHLESRGEYRDESHDFSSHEPRRILYITIAQGQVDALIDEIKKHCMEKSIRVDTA